jgi:hypothetical protein
LVGAVIAVALSAPFGPLDGPTRSEIRRERLLAEHADAALATLDHGLDAIPSSRSWTGDVDLQGRSVTGHESLLVPVLLRPRMSIDLGVPLTNVGGLTPRHAIAGDLLYPGQVIFHDRLGDAPADAYAAFEHDQPSDLGSVRLVPTVSDAAHGWWVLAAR